jgi:hypothetical protein
MFSARKAGKCRPSYLSGIELEKIPANSGFFSGLNTLPVLLNSLMYTTMPLLKSSAAQRPIYHNDYPAPGMAMLQ